MILLLYVLENSEDRDIVERYYILWCPAMLKVARRFFPNECDAEDVVMKVFDEIMDKYDNWKERVARSGFSALNFLKWMTKNRCKDLIRTRAREIVLPLGSEPDAESGAEAEAAWNSLTVLDGEGGDLPVLAELRRLLDELDEREWVIMQLYYYARLTKKEVAEKVGMTENGVKSVIFRFLKRARARIGKEV